MLLLKCSHLFLGHVQLSLKVVHHLRVGHLRVGELIVCLMCAVLVVSSSEKWGQLHGRTTRSVSKVNFPVTLDISYFIIK